MLKQFFDSFITHVTVKGYSPLTIRNFRILLTRFLNWVGDRPITEKQTIEEYHLYLMGLGIQSHTQNNYLKALKAFFKYLSDNDVEVLAPHYIELGKEPEHTVYFLSEEEVRLFLGYTVHINSTRKIKKRKIIQARNKAIIELLFSTGLRVSEVPKIDISSINFVKGEFSVIGKGGRARLCFLSRRAIEAISQYLKVRGANSEALFLGSDGTRIDKQVVQLTVKKVAKAVGLSDKVSAHKLRHSFAYDLLSNGANIRVVQELLGHKSVTTTQLYTRVTNNDLRDQFYEFHGGNNTI